MTHINLANNLTDKVKTDALEMLKNDPEEFFYNQNSALRNTIALMYSGNIIDDKKLEEVLDLAVFKQAENDLNFMLSPGDSGLKYADFLPRPELLAYAIEKRIFSREDERTIPLSPGITLETFCRDYGQKDLISKLKKELKEIEPVKPHVAYEKEQTLLDQLENDDFMRRENPS